MQNVDRAVIEFVPAQSANYPSARRYRFLAEKWCDRGVQFQAPLDLRNVPALRNDHFARMWDSGDEVIGIRDRAQSIVLTPDNKGRGRDSMQPSSEPLVGYRPDEPRCAADRPIGSRQ